MPSFTTSTSAATIEAFVRGFILTAEDGSKRVNADAMVLSLTDELTWQDGPVTGANRLDRLAKRSNAAAIVNDLQSVVGREHWATDPRFPLTASNDGRNLIDQLTTVRDKINTEVGILEAIYTEFLAGLTARAKAIFTDIAAGNYPGGAAVDVVTRTYVETFVTDRGEESRPSPASDLLTMQASAAARITCNTAPTGRFITLRRLYRSATGTTSSAFKLQGEYPISTTVIDDTKPDEQLNDVCATFGWLEPPATLQGLTGLPNGIMLGYDGRTLYACEPYAPYAYPAKYDKPLAHQITGIVAVGQSALIGTAGRPYFLSGSDSASLSEEVISSRIPCLSARSMVAIGSSVFYASPDGLALYESGRVTIVTKAIIDRKKWRAYKPATMRAAEFNGMYLAFYTRADNSQGALIFDYENKTFSEFDQGADALFADESGMYALLGTAVIDLLPPTGDNRTGKWFSKTFRLARPQSIGWIMVDSDFLNNGNATSAVVRVYGDNALLHTATISSNAGVRCKPGKFSNWRVEIESAARIDGCVLATTTEELKAVV